MARLQSVFLVFTKTLVLLISLHHVSSSVSPTSTSTITTLAKHNNVTDRQALLAFKSKISGGLSEPPAFWKPIDKHYLHSQCETPIVHCDLKPSNILLDTDMTAHVGDFGLAKFLKETVSKYSLSSSSSIGLKGTVGYIAPEYGLANKVSVHGDVFSYGILLLEMFTAKRPTDKMFKEGQSLREFVVSAFSERILDVMDAHLFLEEDGEASDDAHNLNASRIMECVASVLRVGILCSNELPADRMEMKEIINELVKIRYVFSKNETQGERQSKAH